MYFVMDQDVSLAGKYAYFGTEPKGFQVSDWISGKTLKVVPSKIVAENDDDKPFKLTDLVLTNFSVFICSPKLMGGLESAGVSNIEYFPVDLINPETGEVVKDYRAANILGRIKCLDVEKSKCRFFDDGEIRSLKKFFLMEGKIGIPAGQKSPIKMFRLDEFPFIALVEDKVKAALEKIGVIGIQFVKPSDYVGF